MEEVYAMEGGMGGQKPLYESDDEDEPEQYRVIDIDMKSGENRQFCNNYIRTAKYNLFSFLPLNLLTQFSKAQNLYFLLIAYMQTVKRISISGGKCAMALPLGVVVFISIIKDAYEDYQRHKSDNEENLKTSLVYNNQSK